jgi:alpha-L-fucosidase
VVLVTKHHDGYCLWPTSVPNPRRAGWHSDRDIVGELAEAVRDAGMRFGLYYSGGLDWTFDDRPIGTFADLVAAVPSDPAYGDYAEAQVHELIDRYRPAVLWNDIAWPFGGERLWRLFADYYAAVPDGVINDRWMPRSAVFDLVRTRAGRSVVDRFVVRSANSGRTVPPTPPHFDVRTPEYSSFDTDRSDSTVCRAPRTS